MRWGGVLEYLHRTGNYYDFHAMTDAVWDGTHLLSSVLFQFKFHSSQLFESRFCRNIQVSEKWWSCQRFIWQEKQTNVRLMNSERTKLTDWSLADSGMSYYLWFPRGAVYPQWEFLRGGWRREGRERGSCPYWPITRGYTNVKLLTSGSGSVLILCVVIPSPNNLNKISVVLKS